ncbi:MAG: glycosyltransferase family 2 protein [Leptolyngbyaceae bacterium]|nr:glycosyltransferase family 2 protein [Leptolyngbyaceae bacterium]
MAPPLVSIGMPVYNGERYLRAALNSLLAQTFEQFELIIADNASTDQTGEICQEYATRDRRIQYYRHDRNLGAAWNFNRVFELSRGQYFKWAAHDDVVDPTFLAKGVAVLDQDPTVVLCHCKVKIIDDGGDVVGDYDTLAAQRGHQLTQVNSSKVEDRFGDLVLVEHFCFEAFALIRADILRQTPLIAPYVASDRVLLAELGLWGRFHEIPEPLFFSRDHPSRSVHTSLLQLRSGWFDAAQEGRMTLPHWKLWFEYSNALNRVSLSPYERLACYQHLAYWPWVYGTQLVRDLWLLGKFIGRSVLEASDLASGNDPSNYLRTLI